MERIDDAKKRQNELQNQLDQLKAKLEQKKKQKLMCESQLAQLKDE